MKRLWMLSLAALMVLGYTESGAEVHSTLPESQTKSEAVSQAGPKETRMAENRAGSTDPVFRDYEYPGADFDGTFSMGNIVSASYFSQDPLSKVIEFYNQKFPGTAIQAGTATNFSKSNPDGSHLSATISQVGEKTQIILKLER